MKRSDVSAPLPCEELDLLAAPLDGCNLIEASAGTGKTFAIVRLYLRLLLERELTVREILVVTFTEAATGELKERIHAALHAALHIINGKPATDDFIRRVLDRVSVEAARPLLVRALRSFDTAAVHTIHGFCSHVLHERAFESGTPFTSGLLTDEHALIEETASDFWRHTMYDASPAFIAFAYDEGCRDPSFFRDIVESVKGMQAPHLFPEKADDLPVDGLETACEKHAATVQNMWRSSRDEIVFLLASTALKQNVYSPKSRAKMVRVMDGIAAISSINGDDAAILKKWTLPAIIAGARKDTPAPEHPIFGACDELYKSVIALHEAFRQKLTALSTLFLSLAGKELEKKKVRRNLVSFDDMLLRVDSALKGKKNGAALARALRTEYRAALIDEFQDTDPVQYRIFNSVFGRDATLFLIGDPKQAIYRFRGADIFAYFTASQNAMRKITLTTNYRSAPRLLSAINTLFASHSNPFASDKISYREVRAGAQECATELVIDGKRETPFSLWVFDRDNAADGNNTPKKDAAVMTLTAVGREISRLLAHGREGSATIGGRVLRPSDIAVMVRTNDEAGRAQRSLAAAGIPAVIYLSESVFRTFEAFEFQILLTAIAAPDRTGPLKAALATSFFGLTANAINDCAANEAAWEHWQSRIAACRDRCAQRGVLAMVRALMNEENLRARLLERRGGERALTNIIHCAELLHAEELRSGTGLAHALKWLSDKRNDLSRTTPPDEEMVRLESDAEAVKIVTIHKSKGMEYPVVFCPFNGHSSELPPDKKGAQPVVFHDPGRDFAATIALGAEAVERFRPFAEEELLAENMRLLYVALTRAQSRCYCVWQSVRGAETSALAWLLFGSSINEQYVPSLRAAMVARTIREIAKEVRDKFGPQNSCMEIISMPKAPERTAIETVAAPHTEPLPETMAARSFSGTVPAPRSVLSYSAIAHSPVFTGKALPDYDATGMFTYTPPATGNEIPGPSSKTIFDFPQGTKSGIFFHALLEQTDFQNAASGAGEQALTDLLTQYGFGLEWKETVAGMVRDTAGLQLDAALDLRLAAVPLPRCMREMEFHFPLQPFAHADLFALVGEEPRQAGFTNDVGGHIKGYIDLVFEWRDRFFIIDWKSNYLGASPKDYAPDALAEAMHDGHYLLQYHLYTVALYNYLKLRKPGYSYKKNFGGVYYVFLRGISRDPTARTGLFFDRPDETTINKLCSLLMPV